jgi:predicted AAA+ superfamily ATPase
MYNNQDWELFLQFNEKAKQIGKNYQKKRYLFDEALKAQSVKVITGISGLRGCGKTVLLYQLLNHLKNAFYITGDIGSQTNLYSLADMLNKRYKIRFLLIDEIHRHRNWGKELKLIYDHLPIKVYFTSSVSLNVLNLKHDLTRRITVLELPIFTFREYLYFYYGTTTAPLSIIDIIGNYQRLLQKHYPKEAYLNEYLSRPLPFMLENPSLKLVKQIAHKVIEKDIFYAGDYSSADIEAMKNIISFVANVPISDINYSVLSKNIGITKYKAKQYVDLLEKGYLLKSIFPYSSSVIKEPKVVLQIPFRSVFQYRLSADQLLGAQREEFFVQAVQATSYPLSYLKSKRGKKTPDYLLLINGKKYIFEIGGPKKGFSQFKGIGASYHKYTITYPGMSGKNKIPLVLFGLL